MTTTGLRHYFSSDTTVPNIADATETVIGTLTGVQTDPQTDAVDLQAVVNLSLDGSATGVLLQLYRGAVADAVVVGSAQQVVVPDEQDETATFVVEGADSLANASAVLYTLTATVLTAGGATSVNFVKIRGTVGANASIT